MRFMNLFMTLTITAMHISYHAGKADVVTYMMQNATAGAMGWFFFMASFWYFKDFDYSIVDTILHMEHGVFFGSQWKGYLKKW